MAPPRHLRSGILILAAVATVFALLATTRLHVETDLLELLPGTTSDLPDLTLMARELEPLEKVVVVLTLPEGPAPDTDLLDLGCRARDLLDSSALFQSVRCGWSAQDEDFLLRWVLPRSVLYLDEDGVRGLAEALAPDTVAHRLAGLRRELESVTGLLSSPFLRADPLGLAPGAMQAAMQGTLTESLVSRAGNRTLIFASIADTQDAAGVGHDLRELLASVSAELSIETHLPVQLEGIGAPFYAEIYESTIRGEAATMVTLSALAAALLLISYFGSLRLPIAMVTGVGAAVIWTGGILAMTRGHMSFIAISMGAVLVGLGVDYGIHVGNDMNLLRASGSPGPRALAAALKTHRNAILSSAATTFIGFIVLTFSSFHPLRELGLLIPLGISLVLLGFACVTLPILLSPDDASQVRASPVRRVLGWIVHGVVRRSQSHPLTVLLLIALATGVLAAGVKKLEFQSDFDLFRPPAPELDQLERLLREDFSLGSGAARILVQSGNLDIALETAARLSDAIKADDPDAQAPLSPAPWLLGGKTIRERQHRLSAEITPDTVDRLRLQFTDAGLQPDECPEFFSTLDAIAGEEPMAAIPREAWPDWLGELVHQDGSETTVSIVLGGDTPVEEARTARILSRFSPPATARVVLFSLPGVGRAIQKTLRSELRRLMGWSVLGICITLLIAFRGRIGWTALALMPAALGVLWLLGLCAWAGIPLNLFTVATFPVLVGIGIDDGLHVAHGAVRDGSAAGATLQRAEAMTMTTLTTMIGFGSLAFSSMPAVSTGGPLIAVGVGLCLLLTLTLPPALDSGILRRRSSRRP